MPEIEPDLNEILDQEEANGEPIDYEAELENQISTDDIRLEDLNFSSINPTTDQPLGMNRRCSNNIIREKEGVRSHYKFNSSGECFKLFFSPDLIKKISKYTNIAILTYNEKVDLTDENEIYAFIGLLYIIGSFKDSTIRTSRLWSTEFGRKLYNGCMSRSRFLEILTFITFDDIKSPMRNDEGADKYSKIQELMDEINSNCIKIFSPSPYLCVDETLSLFKGRCAQFMTYMPSKPGKYGLLIRTCADAKNRYLCSFELYKGKREQN